MGWDFGGTCREGPNLAIKVMLKRVPNREKWPALNEILVELRMLAMSHRGYISGETLLSATDQGTTLVISQWATINGWQEFASSPQRGRSRSSRQGQGYNPRYGDRREWRQLRS